MTTTTQTTPTTKAVCTLIRIAQYAITDDVRMNAEASFWRKDGYTVVISTHDHKVFILRVYEVTE